jgi:heterodisulfide reductase subunit B
VKGTYRGETEVSDFLAVLRDIVGYSRIAREVRKPLNALKAAPYYGCLVLRPPNIAVDNSQNPTVLEEILEAIGVDVIDNPNRTQCCGGFHTVNRKEIVTQLAYDILQYPIQNGADILVTCCPLCAFNLDVQQKEVKRYHKSFREIPVVYYTQLMAVAFGLDEKNLGFRENLHFVDPKSVIDAILEKE